VHEVAAIITEVRAAGFITPAVGVFVDPDPDELSEAITMSGIDIVQLSGEESPRILDRVERPVIKAFPAGATDSVKALQSRIRDWQDVHAIHLDANDPASRGGTGKLANWVLAREIARDTNILLAGGLDPENVAEAIMTVRPHGVDVSSGVETDGVKSHSKIERFIASARAAF
jgi:phosphoribosylanthranilate isomerase